MGRGSTSLDNREYDTYLAKSGKERELRQRNDERRNSGYKGWHFGIGDKPVHTKNKTEFKHELAKRGLMMKDDVSSPLRGPRKPRGRIPCR